MIEINAPVLFHGPVSLREVMCVSYSVLEDATAMPAAEPKVQDRLVFQEKRDRQSSMFKEGFTIQQVINGRGGGKKGDDDSSSDVTSA